MATDRRTVVIGAAGALWGLPSLQARAVNPLRFASAWIDGGTASGIAIVDSEGRILATSALPARGHAIARRPGSGELIAFARRPGRFALVLDAEGRALRTFDAEAERHFFGHGTFSRDGRLLFSSENDIAGEQGVLGIRDATDGYKPIGSFPTNGIGPHDVALLGDKRTLVVANGGVDTDPNGRDVINLAEMRSSLAYVDLVTGDLVEIVRLDDSLRLLSIRHLAIGSGDTVAFGCQWQGEIIEHPPLAGLHQRGKPPVLLMAPAEVHRRLRGYIGSIAVDSSGEILAASAPKGGLAVYWDIPSRRYLGLTELEDVCGLAAAGQPESIVLTSGTGALISAQAGTPLATIRHSNLNWDNHMTALVEGIS